MNQYIATLDGIQLGQINDMADNHTIVMDTLNIWLRPTELTATPEVDL
ncbi:MAG: hypothetical protein ACOYM3_01040 [Terrimicrobiaceae bacterium]